MSTYDKASLVLIPSGTKEGVIFSQKPTNGDGDFTFSRSTAATRVNADGLIEKETQNLLLQSNSFDTTWINSSTTEAGGQTGYDGSSDAWLLTKTGANGRIYQDLSSSGVQTFSVYAKANASNWVALWTNVGTSYFDLANGIKGSTTASTTIGSAIESVGSGWYRCSLIFNTAITSVRIFVADSDGVVSGTSGSIYIQDAQLEQGLVARDYIETTTSAVYGGITDNIPRLDYNGSCPSLLLEPQRTNLTPQSEYFSASTWSLSNTTILDNNAVSPEGVNNASRITSSAGGAPSNINNTVYKNANTDYTFSVFVKAGNVNRVLIGQQMTSLYSNNIYDLSTNTWVSTGTGSPTLNAEDYGNGWYRLSVTLNSGASASNYQSWVGPINNSGTSYFNTTTGNYIYAYGAQLEASSFPTSYIPTYGASVTRVADSCVKTGVSDLIGQTEGTLFLDLEFTNANKVIVLFTIHDNASDKRIEFWANNDVVNGFIGGSVNIAIGNTTISNGRHKMAIAYNESGDQAFYVDGVQIGTSSTAYTIASLTSMTFEHYSGSATYKTSEGINQALVFKTRLSNEELADLTTI